MVVSTLIQEVSCQKRMNPLFACNNLHVGANVHAGAKAADPHPELRRQLRQK